MPLYEYECTRCKRHTEKRQKFSDPEITACPHCGGVLERVLSAPAIAFKGGGWYKDGYGSSAPLAAKAKADGDSSASSSASSDSSGTASATTPAPASSPTAAPAPAASSSSSSSPSSSSDQK